MSVLREFACPICGQVRPITDRAARAIRAGERSGICQSGTGCQRALDQAEKLRRWWLIQVGGIAEIAVARAGGAREYVGRHGLPDALASFVL